MREHDLGMPGEHDRTIMELCAIAAEEFRNQIMVPLFPEVQAYAEGRLPLAREVWMHCFISRTHALYTQILMWDWQIPRGD